MTDTVPATAGTSTPAAHTPLDDLRRRVSGRLHVPGDDSYVPASLAWIVNIPQRPLAVLEVRDADDVIAAVRWAVDHDVQVTAQPTGHGANGTLEGVLLLRTRALGGIEVDVQRRTATVGAGVKAGELAAALDGTGLTFLAGSNPDPTVVGMTITGGISWFGRAYGLGSDSIVSVELVDGLGRLRRLSATEDPELFWAVRGGGGDFGVILRMEVALHPAATIHGGQLLWPIERMREVLTAFRDVTETAPEALTLWFHAITFPPFPDVPEPLRGRSFATVAVAHLGTKEEADALLAPLRAVDGLAMDTLGEVPIGQLGGIAAEPTDPTPGLERSRLLERLDDATIEALTAVAGPGSGSPLAVVQVRHLGGAFARTPDGAGSHGAVTEPYNLFALGIPAVPELVPPIQSAFGRISAAVAGATSGRALLNFLESGEDPALWWGPETRARLARAKELADPLGTVVSNRPVAG